MHKAEPSDDSEVEDEDAPQDPLTGERNSQLTVGYKGDRSYVVRGNNIGVFNHSNDHSVKYYATISNVATPKGKSFKPKNVCPISHLNLLWGSLVNEKYRSCFMIKIRR